MNTTDRHRLAPRLGLAALVCLGAVAGSPFATATAAGPQGNNGTVKVAPYGDIDSIPNNHPHVGCTFQLEWYGFDAGVISTVLFEEQAPTTGVGMTVAGDTTVQLDNDPGAGAGNGGIDGSQAYTLSFTGAPHPQQGYHVKLTINTPESNGATVKHKVFWVQGCGTPPPPPPPPPTTSTPPPPPPPPPPTTTTPPPPTTSTPPPPTTSTPPPTTSTSPPTTSPTTSTTTPSTTSPTQQPQESEDTESPEVLGVQASSGGNNAGPGANQGGSGPTSSAPQSQQVPTAVNAGAEGTAPVGPSPVQVLLGLLMVLIGGAAARLGWHRLRG